MAFATFYKLKKNLRLNIITTVSNQELASKKKKKTQKTGLQNKLVRSPKAKLSLDLPP
jgi:hypothetical protein